MFRKLAGLTAIAGLFVAGTAFAAGPNQMAGSAHDFSGDLWSGGEICVVCHTTHNGSVVQGAPLWNHELTSGGSWQLYTGVDLQGTPQNPGADGLGAGISTLCLSCHDGTVALDSFGGAAGGTNITGAALVTRDLTDDHPIAINYEDAVQTDMQPPSSTSSGIAGGTNIAADMLFGGGATNTLLECASCHDVHNGTGLSKLLIKSNAGSDLCQTCHLK